MFLRLRHKRNVHLIAKRLALFSKTLLSPTMDPKLSKLLIGLDISISRSDGRIHSATVKDVSVAKSSIKVEWTENGTNKGKEVDLSEMNELNSELMKHLHSLHQEEPKTSPAHVVAPTKIPAKSKKGTELLLRSSRIPACAEPHPKDSSSGEPASRRMTTRQTCLFQRPDPPPVILATLPEDGLTKSLQKSALPKSAGLPQVPEVTKVRSKRLSIAKYPESQKKGKFGDAVGRSKPFHQMIEEYRENLEKVPMSLSDPVKAHRICVCVRKRPLNKKEVVKKEIDVVTIPGNGVLLLHEPKQKVDLTKYLENQTFRFDYSFDEDVTNDTVYRFTAKPLVKTIFEGGMATCFAYGQTGSGKTHTMGGNFSGKTQNSSNGIYALAAQDVFNFLGQKRYADMDLCPYVTFFEIYNGKVFDLLNKKAMLRVLEDERQQVNVVGLLEMPVLSVEDVIKLIERGSACRTSGQTFANASSSRSHAILQVILRRRDNLHGKFSLVDLAGNERGNDIKSNDRHTIVETAEINRSLLALKECIRSLGQNSEHIPFRMSKLTQVLRDSFIGENSRTCMIAMISPGMSSCEYTLNTLRYANRVKELNGVSKDASLENGTKHDSEEEEESVPLEFDAISQVAEMEVQFFENSKVFVEVIRSMESPTFDVVERHSEIDLVMKNLQESYQALTLAIEAEQKIRMIHEV